MKPKLIVTAFLFMILVAACGSANTPNQEPTPDVAAIRTSAASTVVSGFTLTAAVFTVPPSLPTDTAAPEATQATSTVTVPPAAQVTTTQGTSVALCDVLEFVADVNIPDGTSMAPGQDFLKTWRVKNSGSCTWDADYKLVYAEYADKMSGQW